MTTNNQPKLKCGQCKQSLNDTVFFYNNKSHTTCFSCSKIRISKKNVCSVCGIRAIYNITGETIGIRCSSHREPTMINVISPKCVTCKVKRPGFNHIGEIKALYCGGCALPNMVDIKNPKCVTCKVKQPTFNEIGETKALYCSECALSTMVNIKSPKCITCKIKVPNFNKECESKALYCKECALPTMVDIKSPKCVTCKIKQPNFNHIGETKALYCGGCALPNMVDINHPKCAICKTRASYGFPGLAPTMCVTHKTENMITKPRSKCKKQNCKLPAIYGIKHPIHCETHKNGNDINLTETRCNRCGLLDVCINGLCINICSDSEQITYEMKRRQKVKEIRILNILKCEYGEPHEYNVRVSSKCGCKNSEEKEFGYDFGTHKLYIEVDENQHKSYCELGEINRMKNIYMDDGGVPVIFLRYNPDNYQINGKKQNTSQQKREVELVKWVKYYQNVDNIQGYDLSVQYLFYTDGDNTKLHNIEPYGK